MGPPFIPKTVTSEIETGLYTEGFAAILSEREALAPISAPVEARRTMHGHRGPSSDDVRHLPALKAAALGWLLLLGSGAASWYAIVSPMQRTPTIVTSLATTSLHIRPTSMPNSRLIQGENPLTGAVQAVAAADEFVLAMIDPIFPKPTEIKVETAALLTPATVLPSPTTDRPARDLVVSAAVEPTLSAPPSTHPNDTIGARPGDELENPHTVRNGEVKEALGNPFDDLYPEKPQRALSKISTASREGTRSSGADVPDAKGDTRDATSHTGLQDPKPAGGARSGSSQSKKESKSDNGGHGSNGPASGGKGPKAGKDKPSAGKSAPAGLQDNHRSNGGKPSPRKADQNQKSDADKKNKDKPGKDKDKPGKDKDDNAKGKGPH
jgi:hypothetical protein